LEMGNFCSRCHGALLYFVANRRGKKSLVHCNNDAKKNNWGQIPIIA
jgi:hypothetical protein